jgi:hypothetical protein
MDTFIEMDFDEWVAEYKPILNHIDNNASFGGLMFETYGDEYEFVKQSPEKNIWMYGDGDDGGSYIWSGWGFVNRIGYFITDKPFPDNVTIQIKVSSYWYYCEGCGAEIEDDGQLINERYYEYERCPICITEEEMVELEKQNEENPMEDNVELDNETTEDTWFDLGGR